MKATYMQDEILELDVPIHHLQATVVSLTHVMFKEQINTHIIERIFTENLKVLCLGCGTVLNPDEIKQLLVSHPQSFEKLPMPLQRLLAGYCPNLTCNSRYYAIRLFPCKYINWHNILKKAIELRDQKELLSFNESSKHAHPLIYTSFSNLRSKKGKIIGGAILLIIIASIIYLIFYHYNHSPVQVNLPIYQINLFT